MRNCYYLRVSVKQLQLILVVPHLLYHTLQTTLTIHYIIMCHCAGGAPLSGEGRGVLALTERRPILTSLLSRATSLSCASLSGRQLLDVMLPLLQLLQDKPPREQPVLYVIDSELNVALDLATQVQLAHYSICLQLI
jgi:hypothetical protein